METDLDFMRFDREEVDRYFRIHHVKHQSAYKFVHIRKSPFLIGPYMELYDRFYDLFPKPSGQKTQLHLTFDHSY